MDTITLTIPTTLKSTIVAALYARRDAIIRATIEATDERDRRDMDGDDPTASLFRDSTPLNFEAERSEWLECETILAQLESREPDLRFDYRRLTEKAIRSREPMSLAETPRHIIEAFLSNTIE